MRFAPVMPIKSQSGKMGMLYLAITELDELREENEQLRIMNEYLRREVKELRKKKRERWWMDGDGSNKPGSRRAIYNDVSYGRSW